MDPCCVLGEKFADPSQILYETDNFFVAPARGAIGIEGYLLVLAKDHALGMGDIPLEEHQELREVVAHTKRVLREAYGTTPFVFEHGPKVGPYRGGGCLDHAHLHVVPGMDIIGDLAVDLMRRLAEIDQMYRVDRVDGFARVADIYERRESSYLFVETPEDKALVVEVNFPLPSQYVRRLIGDKICSERWDWRQHPDQETFARTIDRLQGRF